MALWWGNGDILQQGLSHTQVCCTQSPWGRPLLTRTSTGDTQTQFWLGLCGLGLRFVPFPGLCSSGEQVLGKCTVLVGRVSQSPPWSRPLSFQGTLREHRLRWATCLSHLPGPGRSAPQVRHESTASGGPCLSHLPGPGRSASRVRCESSASGVLRVSSGERWQAVTLLADVSHPGSQEDMVSSWEPAHSLVEDALGLRL